MSFAGLWESWKDRTTGEVIESCTIITCAPNAVMEPFHDRMPVILATEDIEAWLGVGSPDLLRPCPDEWLEAYPVSPAVGNVRNQRPELIQPIAV